MSDKKEILEYDEDDSVKFIQAHLPQKMSGKFSNDEINYLVDIVYEYYEEKGFLNETDPESEVEIDEEDLLGFVKSKAKKDDIFNFSSKEVDAIVQGELSYCDSLNIFE